MKKINRVFLVLLSFTLLISMCGCDMDNSDRSLLYETEIGIVNIDPQLATNDTELHIVHNAFEGLMKYNSAGTLINGVAESYTVTNSGKTYTFKLNPKSKWSDGRPLTANDFEFAFRRAVAPESQSPYASTLLPIKNVSKILSGKLSPEEIAVKAVNDYELVINLEGINKSFLHLLTTPVSMPCNQEFFLSCKGYYGLNRKSIISNGYYQISAWNEEYCTLTANESYEDYGSSKISTAYIYFNSEDELFENIEKQEPHFSILSDEMINRLDDSQIEYNPIHIGNTVHSLIFNPDSLISEINILKALTGTISFDISADLNKKYGITAATSILPTSVDYSNKISFNRKSTNKDKALDNFILGCENLKIERIFPPFSIIYLKNDTTEAVAQQIASNWQGIFGITVNITAVENEEELTNLISSSAYDVAIISNKAISSSPIPYLQQFTSDAATNISSFKSNNFDKAVKKMNRLEGKELLDATKAAANIINDNKYIHPLFVSSKTYYFGSEVKPQFNPLNQIVYFSQVEFN